MSNDEAWMMMLLLLCSEQEQGKEISFIDLEQKKADAEFVNNCQSVEWEQDMHANIPFCKLDGEMCNMQCQKSQYLQLLLWRYSRKEKHEMKIVNVRTRKILTSKPLSWDNEFIKGIRMSRYFASWIRCGGDIKDRDGFIEWMMNIPFDDGHGGFTYVSEDEAVDTYSIMKCGKSELERWAREYLAEHRQKKK